MSQEYFVHGLDEAGHIGEKLIFCDASTSADNETILMLKNLLYFNKLVLNKNDVRGFDQGSLLKFVSDLIDDESIFIRLYYMDQALQNTLLRGLFLHFSNEFFRMRGELIKLFDVKDWSIIQRTLNDLNRFKRKAIYAESFVKSFGMKEIVSRLSKYYLARYGGHEPLAHSSGPRIDIQIDGGFPFAFWWKDILDNEETGLVKGKSLITGITNGDSYYPLISLAGTISSVLHRFPGQQHLFPINHIPREGIDIMSEAFYIFYRRHAYSLSRPVYQNRLLIIGSCQNELKTLLPYVLFLHERRTKTFETFHINTSVENFMKDFGYGRPENTNILLGNIKTAGDRDSISFCEEREYPISEINNYKDELEELFTALYNLAGVAPSRVRSELNARLARLKTVCFQDLQ